MPGDFSPQETAKPDQIRAKIQAYLETIGLGDWQVRLTDSTNFYFRVKARQKTILMSPRVSHLDYLM
ncbi:hypothetical protein A2W24_01220 [Microgenomates group bacterium RBG_16_45_19]|nr:MAG: hypothetical protein A2W24_01220 [Microgenomates group bacterium RBG_16_45_19]